ncbi:MAG: hypothetical protein IJ744_00925 [Lachnospiraceae bacterium]|nr:hypothetical protein [Lachnospiraceae bacterium]
MKIRELLEQDKERFLARLTTSDTMDRSVEACEEEIGRLLVRYQEEAPSEQTGETASYALQTVRAALPLLDSTGEVISYERISEKKGNSAAVPTLCGIALTAIGSVLLVLGPQVLYALDVVLLVGGIAGTFLGGARFGLGRRKEPSADRMLAVKPDHEKIYHNLHSLMTVVDQYLDDTYLKERTQSSELHLPIEAKSPVPEEELQLFSDLLEAAYSEGDDPAAQGMISEIKFYLHKKGVELCDCTPQTKRYFSLMPGQKRRTIRPAMLREQTVLIKGLASGSFEE